MVEAGATAACKRVVGRGLGREGRRKEEEKEVVVRKRRVVKVFIFLAPLCLCVYVCECLSK